MVALPVAVPAVVIVPVATPLMTNVPTVPANPVTAVPTDEVAPTLAVTPVMPVDALIAAALAIALLALLEKESASSDTAVARMGAPLMVRLPDAKAVLPTVAPMYEYTLVPPS
jgi:hypothetical protein